MLGDLVFQVASRRDEANHWITPRAALHWWSSGQGHGIVPCSEPPNEQHAGS
jgi:hypothetical protein